MPKVGPGRFPRVVISDGAGHYLTLPSLTTTQRDALTGVAGMLIYNATTTTVQSYEAGAWADVGAGEIAVHAALDTGVHGVGASTVESASGAQTKVNTHAADGDAHANGGHVSVLLSSYNSVGQGIWAADARYQAINGSKLCNQGSNGDNISYLVYLVAGTWTLRIYHHKDTDHGKLDVYIDAAKVVSALDTYASGASDNNVSTTTGIVIAASGLKTLKIEVNGKNDLSSAYSAYLEGIIALWRTA